VQERAACLDSAALLVLAGRAARDAAVAILAARRSGFAVRCKSDASPVTSADLAASAAIEQRLGQARPGIPIISEEGAAPLAFDPGGPFWAVDPLDGTREFMAGCPEFTVNIGLVLGRQVRLGVVAVPAAGTLFGGRVGEPAWCEDAAGRRRTIEARRPCEAGHVVVVSRFHADAGALASFLSEYRVDRMEHAGSALKICRVAEGTADLYPRLGRTMEWDTAGPQAVLEAAGGTLTTLDGAALRYGKPGFANPPFVCKGRL
jgi:3'(2'), 5'-bisphosphate nucleotidase